MTTVTVKITGISVAETSVVLKLTFAAGTRVWTKTMGIELRELAGKNAAAVKTYFMPLLTELAKQVLEGETELSASGEWVKATDFLNKEITLEV